MLDRAPDEKETWLLGHGLPLTTDLGEDHNGDGVSLLMAYALDLDPNQQLQGRMPVPVVDGSSLALTFREARPDTVSYTVETSVDMVTWTPLITVAASGTGITTHTDTASGTEVRRIYRVKISQ